ncbi:MAG: heavy metal-binding domain-containing protein [Candidatus Thalassarchaeaceae archaeon]|nr:heavy metal-binding domain-containing protein [Candidatus Thalassarchaeaceae archaeon]
MISDILGSLLTLFLLFWVVFGLIFGIIGIIYMFVYPILLIWGLVFSGKNLDEMIAKTVEREATVRSKIGKDPLSTIDGGYRKDVKSSGIVWAGAVYAPSHWQLLRGFLNNIIGGSIDIFQKVLSAGRAESMQRLREVAIQDGWDEVINVRIDTAPMTPASHKKGIKAVEVFAYGTGIKYS